VSFVLVPSFGSKHELCTSRKSSTRPDVAPPPIPWRLAVAVVVAAVAVVWAASRSTAGTTRFWRLAGTTTFRGLAWALAAGPWSPAGLDAARTVASTAAIWPSAATATPRRHRPPPTICRSSRSASSVSECTLPGITHKYMSKLIFFYGALGGPFFLK